MTCCTLSIPYLAPTLQWCAGVVEEIHDSACSSYRQHDDLIGQVKYPLYPTSELNNPTKWKEIYEIDLSKGGMFLAEPVLKDHLPDLLALLASFVTYTKEKRTDWVKDPSVYDALPNMIIHFAKNSRIDSGYRLLERCVRHGHDPKMESLFNSKIKVIQVEDGSIGFVIEHKVPASMRNKIYDTRIAHTSQMLPRPGR